MNADKIVQRIVRGSARIDRMRSEIDTVARILISLIGGNIHPDDMVIKRLFTGDDFSSPHWLIRIVHRQAMAAFLPADTMDDERCWYSTDGRVPAMWHVAEIHRDLPVLIAGARIHFPWLDRAFKPLLDAAGK